MHKLKKKAWQCIVNQNRAQQSPCSRLPWHLKFQKHVLIVFLNPNSTSTLLLYYQTAWSSAWPALWGSRSIRGGGLRGRTSPWGTWRGQLLFLGVTKDTKGSLWGWASLFMGAQMGSPEWALYWELWDMAERGCGGGVSLSVGALWREPGEGGLPCWGPWRICT